jgi:hypothetical protein
MRSTLRNNATQECNSLDRRDKGIQRLDVQSAVVRESMQVRHEAGERLMASPHPIVETKIVDAFENPYAIAENFNTTKNINSLTRLSGRLPLITPCAVFYIVSPTRLSSVKESESTIDKDI